MVDAEKQFSLSQIHHQRNEVPAPALDLKVVAFRDPVDTQMHLSSTGHPHRSFLAQEEVAVFSESFPGVDRVVVRLGYDGHAELLEPGVNFRGLVVGLTTNPAEYGSVAHARCD